MDRDGEERVPIDHVAVISYAWDPFDSVPFRSPVEKRRRKARGTVEDPRRGPTTGGRQQDPAERRKNEDAEQAGIEREGREAERRKEEAEEATAEQRPRRSRRTRSRGAGGRGEK